MNPSVALEPCTGCGGLFAAGSGATHRYLESSPGCWAAFGEVLAREYSDPKYFVVHRLTVDAYAVQHPGQPSPQNVQSLAIHLIGLCLTCGHGLSPDQVTVAMQVAAKEKARFRWLAPPAKCASFTMADVRRADTAGEHIMAVQQWVKDMWHTWAEHHDTIRAWLPPRYTIGP